MSIYEALVKGEEQMAVVGLGYVGMPLAYEFAKKVKTLGFDTNKKKIELYRRGIDVTNEIGNEKMAQCQLKFATDEEQLEDAKFFIIAVPTPIDNSKKPDLNAMMKASQTVGRRLKPGSVVVYESTVYPGVTEEICIPILEEESGLKCPKDFKVGYSPERINPGDKNHTITSIKKIVAGCDEEALEEIAKVYEIIVRAGVYRAESIKVAEAAKVIENAQRDINIAFMNELSIIFHKLDIDTRAVLRAAQTKWNFQQYYPGLVGGHCIGVDPYYLSYKSELIGYHPQIILSGRRINDDMGKYVAENTVKKIIQAGKPILGSKVLILGVTFKENVADTRNSKVIDIIRELKEYGINIFATDPIADKEETFEEYGVELLDEDRIGKVDAVILAVSHKAYGEKTLADLKEKFRDNHHILIDVKGMFSRELAEKEGFSYWCL
ncbi:MAG: nucleotide sugar dehydrogenase [Acetivibrionales bacterium]|jgi:UDP-N-acetyl-D-galactosamine dehydrogenase|nr:nucleotide sugar dehydrogenase [Clostridiaceae bacterium]